MKKSSHKMHFWKNVIVVGISFLGAYFLAQAEVFEQILTSTKEFEIIGSFIAGVFFTSMFTIAPAGVALAEIAHANSILLVAISGGLGAVVGDLILLKFLKSHVSDGFTHLFSHPKSKRLFRLFHLNIFHWFMVFLGAVVIASPIPDEIGLAMMGLSKIKLKFFIPLSFALNSIGIFIIGLIAKQVI